MAGQTLVISVLADTKNFTDGFGGMAKVAAAAAAAVVAGTAAFIATSIKAAAEAEKIAAQTTAALESTGGAAGRTADQISDLAQKISSVTGIDDEAIQSAQNLLLTFTEIKGTNFDAATQAVADLSTAMGTDMSSAAQLVGKALNDPVAGMSALSRVGVQLTDEQKALVKSLTDVGDTAGAQAVILGVLAEQFGGSAEAYGNTFLGSVDKVKNAFGNIQEQVGNAFLPVLTGALGKVADFLTKLGSNPGFVAFVDGVGSFLSNIVSGQGAVGGLVSQLAPLLSFLSPLGIIFQVIKPLLPELMAGFQQVAEAIGGALMGILPTLLNVLQTVVGLFSNGLATILPVLIPVIVQLAQVIGETLAAVMPVVAALLDNFTQVIAALIPVVLPLIEIVLTVVQAFLPLLPLIGELIGALLPPLIQLFTSLLVPILKLIAPIIELLIPAIKLNAEVLSFLIGIIVQVITFLVKLVSGNKEAADQVRTIWNGILTFFQGIPAAIGGFFANAGKFLYEAGRNIIQGLINGLSNAIAGVWNFLEDAAANIANTFGNILGIHSPSTVFAEFGRNIIAGLELGLSGANHVGQIVGGIANQVSGGFNAGLAAPETFLPASELRSGGNVTLSVTSINPVGEPTSETVREAQQLAEVALGV